MHVYHMPNPAPSPTKPLLVLISGPYLPDTDSNPEKIAANRAPLESFALPIYIRGHLPMRCGVRIPGDCRGADLDVLRARQPGLPIYTDVSELPSRLPATASGQ
jgi:hypothetical protein